MYSITRACSLGHLSTCACDPGKKGKGRDKKGQWFEWGGCSDDVNYGRKFARTFIDAKERKNMDARALMNLHNNRAGRQVMYIFKIKRLSLQQGELNISNTSTMTIRPCFVVRHTSGTL